MSLPPPDAPLRCLPRTFSSKNGLPVELHRLPADAGQRLVDMYLAFQPRNSFQGLPPIKDAVCVNWVREMLRTGINVIAIAGGTGWQPAAAPGRRRSSATPPCFPSTRRSARCWWWFAPVSKTSASAPNWCEAASTWPTSWASSGFGCRWMPRTCGPGTSTGNAGSIRDAARPRAGHGVRGPPLAPPGGRRDSSPRRTSPCRAFISPTRPACPAASTRYARIDGSSALLQLTSATAASRTRSRRGAILATRSRHSGGSSTNSRFEPNSRPGCRL